MRPVQQGGMNKQRSRGRGRGKPHISGGGGGSSSGNGGLGAGRGEIVNLNRTLDSNGPDIKIRGTVAHIYEKYQNLARDANSQGDHVGAENYLQHAEHYYRLLAAANQAQAASRERENARNPGNRRLPNQENVLEAGEQSAEPGYDDGMRTTAPEQAAEAGLEESTAGTA
ncbi:MAG: DUF4167 domain-containing protein [Pseudomonadota bacterium]